MTPSFSRVMRVGSLALGYPDVGWRQDLPLLHATADAVAGPAQAGLRAFLEAVAARSPGEFQQAYVETFDLRRRCCPYLTYYSCGDTRKRGMALLQFTAAYRAADRIAFEGMRRREDIALAAAAGQTYALRP